MIVFPTHALQQNEYVYYDKNNNNVFLSEKQTAWLIEPYSKIANI